MNKYNPDIHHRRSIRLKGYDYSQAGLYFITICCQDKTCLFGDIKNGEMVLNDAGEIANNCWLEIPEHFPNVIIHEYVIMPNHVHGIIELVGTEHFPSNDVTNNNVGINANNIVGIDDDKTTEKFPSNKNADENSNNRSNNNMGTDENGNNRSNNIIGMDENGNNRSNNITETDENGNNRSNNITETDENGNNRSNNYSTLRSPSKTIGSIVRGFKIGVTKWFRQQTDIKIVWQRNYYEHIIRNEQSYQNISKYIINNPKKWQEDKFHK